MSSARFKQKLSEQIRSLQLSSAGFDGGLEHEAIRIAQTLRVIFHQTKMSTSLMTHMKMTTGRMVSTVPAGKAAWTGFVGVHLNLGSRTPVRCFPVLGDKFFDVSMSEWWGGTVIHTFGTKDIHRRELVLAAANTDGGAHVSDVLQDFYEELANGRPGIAIHGKDLVYPNGLAPFDQTKLQTAQNLHLAMIRQFGHEVIASANHFKWLA